MLRRKITQSLYRVSRGDMLACLNELDTLQWHSETEIHELQKQWLYALLHYANVHVPYYRDLFKRIGFCPDDYLADPACFQDLPLLTKTLIHQEHDRLITTDPAQQGHLLKTKTGGTTGEPMHFVQDQVYDNYRVAHNFHQMMWSGWQLGQPTGRLWGHVLSGTFGKKSLATKIKEWGVQRVWSNAFNMTPESMTRFAKQLTRHPDRVVWSYVSTMYRFAQFVESEGYTIKLHAIYTAAEPLYDYHRDFIERVFSCPVFNSYSSVETGDIACECDRHNGLHLMMRNCYLEVLNQGTPVPAGEEGEFIITNLTNFAFPLIRYKIEDWGKMRLGGCTCGRGLPMLDVVEGRVIDFFHTHNRGRVWGAFVVPMIPALGAVKQYQIIQKTLDLLVIRMVTTGDLDETQYPTIRRACKTVLGDNVEVRFERVDTLPTTPTGKHRYVVSEVSEPSL